MLTANKGFLLGYTNEGIHVQNNVPAIIFDDFTMESKYVDVPFSVRSSAIKILNSRDKNVLFFCYLLLSSQHFPSLGHARHYISYVQKRAVFIPSIDEQTQISNLFKTLDSMIAAAQRQKDLLERKKQAYLQQMFPNGDENVPALRFRGFSNIWEQQRLQNLTTRTGSGGTPSSSNPDYYGGNIPFLGISDMSERYVDTTEKSLTRLGLNNSSAWIVPSGSIVLSMYASCGKVAITRIPLATSQAFFILVVNDPILRDFIFERLEAASSLHEWNKLVSTGTQPNLNAKKLNNWQLKMPHNKEQNKIAVFFQTLDSLIITAQRKIDLLKKLKKAYLQKMFI